ncbi:DUF6924 domain-containing protein [Dactylosporangium sp. McL0621]|uniref:DUF6924 domain-containing protein n=1 Tax=Dactylosporangium sp. McL0621 TaxID=3415678 RepID=UPI003CF0FE9D
MPRSGTIVGVPVLPQPQDRSSLILRTDFTNDAAWAELQAAIGTEGATYISDVSHTDVTIQSLIDADTAAADEHKLTYLFLADATTMTDAEHTLLAVDLYQEPGRTFRLPPRRYADVSANLSISNMDFHEFADAVDESGTYRGFDDE